MEIKKTNNTAEKDYSSYSDWKEWSKKPFGSYELKQYFYYRKIIKSFLQKDPVQVLELGFGNGEFAGWLKSNIPNAQWTGFEIQNSLVTRAQDAGFNSIKSLSHASKNSPYDLIVAFDVLEHLSDKELKELFTDLGYMLSDDGVIICRTPNGGGPLGLPNQYGDPTHRTPITVSRLSSYLPDWTIKGVGDLSPLWQGKILSSARNLLRLMLRFTLEMVIRFAFAPQPKTILASNLLFKITKIRK